MTLRIAPEVPDTELSAPGAAEVDDLDRDRHRRHTLVWIAGLGALLGAVVCGGVAIAGVALQAMVRNVLADPYVLAAATSFLIFASDSPEGARSVLFWLLGSLSLARWSSLGIAAVVVVLSLALLLRWGRRLDALAIGDATAQAQGVSPTPRPC